MLNETSRARNSIYHQQADYFRVNHVLFNSRCLLTSCFHLLAIFKTEFEFGTRCSTWMHFMAVKISCGTRNHIVGVLVRSSLRIEMEWDYIVITLRCEGPSNSRHFVMCNNNIGTVNMMNRKSRSSKLIQTRPNILMKEMSAEWNIVQQSSFIYFSIERWSFLIWTIMWKNVHCNGWHNRNWQFPSQLG